MRELFKIINKKKYIILLMLMIIFVSIDKVQPLILSYYTRSPLTSEKMLKLIIIYIGTLLFLYFMNVIIQVLQSKSREEMKMNGLSYYLKKVEKMTYDNLSKVHSGVIQSLIMDVINRGNIVIECLMQYIIDILISLGTFIYVSCSQSLLTGGIIIILCIIAIMSKIFIRKTWIIFEKATRKKWSKINAAFIDFLSNIITVKKLNIEEYADNELRKSGNDYLKSVEKSSFKISLTSLVFNLIMTLTYGVVFVQTYQTVKAGGDGLPYLIFYLTALLNVRHSINNFARTIDEINKFVSSKKQLDENIKELEKEKELINEFNEVIYSNIKFNYGETTQTIFIPKFEIKKGDKISIIGESGQGKSTSLNIFAGFYKLKEGNVIVDNIEKHDIRLDVVFISQETEFFDTTIRNNLCLGKDVSDEKIIDLLYEAGLAEWYKNLENGLETVVGEKGVKLSAGQKQRLNLIRGILINKEIYFLDETTSNLDKDTEIKIYNMIEKYLKDKTYIIVTHRPKVQNLCMKHYKIFNHRLEQM